MIFCYLVWPCISMYLVILNSFLHTLFYYCHWYLVSKSIVSFEHMISCPSYSLLSYPIVPNTLIIHNLLSYQASLIYNLREFLGELTQILSFSFSCLSFCRNWYIGVPTGDQISFHQEFTCSLNLGCSSHNFSKKNGLRVVIPGLFQCNITD